MAWQSSSFRRGSTLSKENVAFKGKGLSNIFVLQKVSRTVLSVLLHVQASVHVLLSPPLNMAVVHVLLLMLGNSKLHKTCWSSDAGNDC